MNKEIHDKADVLRTRINELGRSEIHLHKIDPNKNLIKITMHDSTYDADAISISFAEKLPNKEIAYSVKKGHRIGLTQEQADMLMNKILKIVTKAFEDALDDAKDDYDML